MRLKIVSSALPTIAAISTSYAAAGKPSGTRTLAPPAFDARIRRDDYGVPHIPATIDADAADGLEFAHSEDDFATIQATLLASRGQLATRTGADGVDSDVLFQLLEIPRVLGGYGTDLPAPLRHILDAYAVGINRYGALHPDKVVPGLLPLTGRDIAAPGTFRDRTSTARTLAEWQAAMKLRALPNINYL